MRRLETVFMEKLHYCKTEQQHSEVNTVVPGVLTCPVIIHVTAALLSDHY